MGVRLSPAPQDLEIMKVYFSVDPEAEDENHSNSLKKLNSFFLTKKYLLFRSPYVFSKDPKKFLMDELKIKRDPTKVEQRQIHFKWIDDSDLLVADISFPSEGRSMIIQRAIDKPLMGLPSTPIILIKNKQYKRRFGKIVQGLLEDKKITFFEYKDINEVIKAWDDLLLESVDI